MKIIPLSILRAVTLAVGIFAVELTNAFCSCQDFRSISTFKLENEQTDKNHCPRYAEISTVLTTLVAIGFIEVGVAAFIYLYFIFKFINPHQQLARLLGPGQSSKRNASGSWCCGWRLTCHLCCTCTSLLTCCLFGGLEGWLVQLRSE